MKCKNETCSNEPKGSSAYCCESCRTIYNRNKRNTGTGTLATGTVPEQVMPEQQPEQTGIDHYRANPDMYATRNNPDTLNWGEPMSVMELEQAGLKANRVAIPGDHDYTGACEQVDGQWAVRA